jgi:putative transcriptional regulator
MMTTTMEKETDLADVAEALSAEPVPPRPDLRQRVLDLLDAPALPLDLDSYAWNEPLPGVRFCTLFESPDGTMRKVLVWAKPGARYPHHRHLGDEDILVLAGRLRDQRGSYGPGDICRSETGTDHSEEVEGQDDCICYVVYRGSHEMLEPFPGDSV